MPDLTFGTSAYSRLRGNLPELPVVNLFVENTPSQQLGVVLQSRPGLEASTEVGGGPIRGLFQADGVLGGALVAVSGGEVYKGATLLGSIAGTGAVSFAASESELLINAGGPIYRTDGTTLTTVSFPDGADVSRIASLAGYFLALRRDTEQLYFSAVLDGSSWDALDYASAEKEPDPLRDIVIVNDMAALLGSQTVEFWQTTGNADIPLAPVVGRVFQKGVTGSGAACRFDNTFAWIAPNGLVYVGADIPQRISDSGIEERLAQSTTYSLWTFFFEGHEFLAVRLDQGTWLFDAQTRQWCEFQSYGRTNWRAQCAAQHGAALGDDETGQIWTLGSGYTDAGTVLERRFRAGAPLSGGAFAVHNVRLTVNVGETSYLSGDYADPVVEMRTSRDAGRSWDTWRQAPMGQQGEYRTRTEWRRCGTFDDPGMLAEFRCTDPVPFRVSAAKVNEMSGGRSR